MLLVIGCDRQPVGSGDDDDGGGGEAHAEEDLATKVADGEGDEAETARADVYDRVCSACHGPEGRGKPELKSPSIAGLPAWYVVEQVEKFRRGWRGFHPGDVPGAQMRAVALGLTETQVEAAAERVEAMPEVLTEPPPEDVDLLPGRRLYARECMACHRYNGRGEVVFHSAPLVTLNRAYLERQLNNYRKGWRGTIESDLYGAKMVRVCSYLDDEDIEQLVDYIGALAHGDDPRPERPR